MQTRLAAKALIVKNNQFLVISGRLLVSQKIYHDLPGGKVEFGETPEAALQREAREEINAEIEISRLLGYYQFLTEDQQNHVTCLTFLCTLQNDFDKLATSNNPDLTEQITSFKFVDKNELLRIMGNSSFSKLIRGSL